MRRSAMSCLTPQRRLALHLLVLICVLSAFLVLPGPSFARSAATAADAVVVAPAGATGNGVGYLADRVATAGGRLDVTLSSRVGICRVDAEAARRLRAAGFAVLRAGAAPPADAPAGVSVGLAALDRLRQNRLGEPLTLRSDLQPVPNDVRGQAIDQAAGLTPPDTRLGLLPSATEPAAFAAGTVAVSVIFVESQPPMAPGQTNAQDWSQARIDAVQAKIATALSWWSTTNPSADLTFVLPPSGALGAPAVDTTSYEPIENSSLSDGLWRHQIMQALGFSNSTDDPPPEVSYDDAVRKANGADWAFTVYVVDDNNGYPANGGAFPDGLFAYTFDLFGPYMVMTYHNDGYGPGLFDAVMAHEMGHVFGALDEYRAPLGYPSSGGYYSGYLWVKNRNAVVGGSTNDVCIMRGGQEGVAAYEGGGTYAGRPIRFGGICQASRGQVGWRDSDRDGVPDVIDTTPTVTLGGESASGAAVTVTGTVHENPWPRGHNAQGEAFTHNISYLVPHDVRYSVDGGAVTGAVSATDGAFDEASEHVTLTTPALGPGPDAAAPTHHTLTVEATTGHTAGLTRDVWGAAGLTTQPVLTLDLGGKTSQTIVLGKAAAVHVTSASGGYPIPWLSLQLTGSGGGAKALATNAAGGWKGSVSPSATTSYRADFAGAGDFLAAQSGSVTVSVRPVLTVTRGAGPIGMKGHMSVGCVFRPARKGVSLNLQETRDGGATWKTVATKTTGGASNVSFSYRPTHRGSVVLRVLFAGDVRNVRASARVPVFSVR